MKNIAVLITCYNRAEVTLNFLKGLFNQKLPSDIALNVFLVDDASPDQTGARVREAFPEVNVVNGTGRLFWCRGMRLAWDAAMAAEKGSEERSRFAYFLWANDDTILNDDAIQILLRDHEETNGVIVGTFAPDAKYEVVSYGATKNIPVGCPKRGTCGMNGNLVLVPRDIFDKVGPIYGMYNHQYGDYDYGWMLRRNGLEYYSSSRFCGVCAEQPERYNHLKGRGLLSRIRLLWDPKSYSIHDVFLYQYRRAGALRAIISCVHVIIKVASAGRVR